MAPDVRAEEEVAGIVGAREQRCQPVASLPNACDIAVVTLILSALLACHLGRPPVNGAAWHVEDVRSAAAEPGLDTTLEAALNGALAVRGALGDAVALRLLVLDASSGVAAADAGDEVHLARLRVRIEVGGNEPSSLVLQAEQAYGTRGLPSGGPGSTLAASTNRAAAFESLANQIAADAADWLMVHAGGSL
jgi:hypothetical protein